VSRDALSAAKQQIKDLSAQVAAATVQCHAQVADLSRQLARMAAAEEAAAAKMDALEADMARTEEKLADMARTEGGVAWEHFQISQQIFLNFLNYFTS